MKSALNLPNNAALNEMRPDELEALLKVLNTSLMTAKGRKVMGIATGGMRQMRITKARILTIQRQRGGR